MTKDVLSPIDLRDLSDAQEWQDTANVKRPWRQDFFKFYIEYIAQNFANNARVLELGSGPGFLAKLMLNHLPQIHYTAFDFSKQCTIYLNKNYLHRNCNEQNLL